MLDIAKMSKEFVVSLNPLADEISNKDKKIIDCLLDNGFKKKEIVSFLNVYKSDVKEYVDFSKKIRRAIKAKAKGGSEPEAE
jgi:hypothetical protein